MAAVKGSSQAVAPASWSLKPTADMSRSLSAVNASGIHAQTAQKTLPTPVRPSTPVRTVSAFAMLESPSTPAKELSSAAHSPGGHKHSDSSRTNSSAGLKTPSGSVFSATLGPSPEIVTTPTETAALASTTSTVTANRVGHKMVAAEVKGIGRVALARDFLFDKLGQSTAEKAIAAATAPSLATALDIKEPKALDPFSSASTSQAQSQPAHLARSTNDTLGRVRSWLESDDKSDNDEVEEPLPAPLPEPPVASEADRDTPHPPFEYSVGGKTVRVLLQSKKRQASEEAAQIVERSLEPGTSARPRRQVRSLYSKGKSAAKAADAPEHCYCARGDDGEPMISCDTCHTWYHHECVDLSTRKTPRRWTCFRCDNSEPPVAASSSKRQRMSSSGGPKTPVLSQEPVLVETVMSPRTRENFYRTAVEHVVLAPSPQSSPVRRFAPRSPLPPYTTPATPQPTYYTRADYSPRSPLLHRISRSRAPSGAYEHDGQPWGHWEAPHAGDSSESQPLFAPVDEVAYHGSQYWHDLNMTPSRSMPGTYSSWSEQYGMHTPMTNSKRHRLVSNGQPFSASQEFLTNLHQTPGGSEADHHPYWQSNFSGRHGHAHMHAAHPSAGVPSSPLAQKQQARMVGHRRGGSYGSALAPPGPNGRASFSHTATSPVLDRASSPAAQYRMSTSRFSTGSHGRGSPADLNERADPHGPTSSFDRPASAASRVSGGSSSFQDAPGHPHYFD